MPLSFLSLSQKRDFEGHTVPIGFTGLALRLGPHAGYTNCDLLLDPHAPPVDRPGPAGITRHGEHHTGPHGEPALPRSEAKQPGRLPEEAAGQLWAVGALTLPSPIRSPIGSGQACVGGCHGGPLRPRSLASSSEGAVSVGSRSGRPASAKAQPPGVWPRVSEDAQTPQKAEGTPFKTGQAGLGNPEHGTRERAHFLYVRRRRVRELLLRVPALGAAPREDTRVAASAGSPAAAGLCTAEPQRNEAWAQARPAGQPLSAVPQPPPESAPTCSVSATAITQTFPSMS